MNLMMMMMMMMMMMICYCCVCVMLLTGFSEERSLTETLRTTMLAYNEILVRTRTEVTRREESTMLREQQDREYRESAEAGDNDLLLLYHLYLYDNKTVVVINLSCRSWSRNSCYPNLTTLTTLT